ncbi:methyl-accepting chemotaxis protein [Clostridium cochlearium]|uniref:methyl-accepting chemotaxis protein n=1 Tax=Clostridium cochlearium TaxID=1494 RepID=UPI000BBCC0B0|nr:HAMP domain-containing methyl-accepting chemotaxis protein [Clostridium cochlearium]
MKFTIRKKLFLAFGVTLFLMFLLSAVSLYDINQINHNVENIYHQATAVNYIKDAQLYIAEVQLAEKDVLLSSNLEEKKEHIMHVDDAFDNGIIKNLNEYQKLSHISNKEKINLLLENIDKARKQQADIVNKSMNNKNTEALSLSKDNFELFQSIEKEINTIVSNTLQESKEKYNVSMNIYHNIIKSILIFSIIALIVSITLTIFISSSIIKPLQKSISFAKNLANGDLTDSLNIKTKDELGILIGALNNTGLKLKDIVSRIQLTSTEISLGSDQLALAMENTNKSTTEIGEKIINVTDSIQEITSTIEETNSSVKSISLSSSKVSSLANEAKDNSLTFREHAYKGKESVDITVSTMHDIENSTKEVKNTISALDTLSSKIGDITSMITNIAKQTNMLALNAAIEAARAGEHGKGFSVVADQVRKLAEESASAANSIEKMILDIRAKIEIAVSNVLITETKVKEGTSVANNTEDHINLIIENMNTLVHNIEEISVQALNQALSTDSIAENMGNIVGNTQLLSISSQDINSHIEEQIAVIEEVSSTSQTLSSMTENLNSMVEYFKVNS